MPNRATLPEPIPRVPVKSGLVVRDPVRGQVHPDFPVDQWAPESEEAPARQEFYIRGGEYRSCSSL